MIYFIGAGSGAADLITVRGAEILKRAEIIIYAGSLVNREILDIYAPPECEIHDSSKMTFEEISEKLIYGYEKKFTTVRLHSGDPALYGAIREQIKILNEKKIPFEIVPGVSSLFAASAALKTEYMIPEKNQTLIISRIDGRTHVPENENLKSLAKHNSSIALFLSSGMIERVCAELIEGGFSPLTPAAVVYKASWSDEKIIKGNLKNLPELAQAEKITKTAIILAGDFLNDKENFANSKLYDKNFQHGFRKI